MTAPLIPIAVSTALALEELDRLKAVEHLPTPDDLLARLRARDGDFDILAGIVGAYLHERGLTAGCSE